MERDYGMEIDRLEKEMSEIKGLLQELMRRNAALTEGTCGADAQSLGPQTPACEEAAAPSAKPGEAVSKKDAAQASGLQTPAPSGSAGMAEGQESNVEVISGMHPNPQLSGQMEELCRLADKRKATGVINYMGVFASGGRQSNWIKYQEDVDCLLSLVENHTAEKVLHCIGNSDRLNILLAILKKPRTVAELVTVCGLNSTGQAYHHMKPLLAADLIAEDDASGTGTKGVYIVRPHKVQGIIMLLAGISDLVDETYTKGNWDNLDA